MSELEDLRAEVAGWREDSRKWKRHAMSIEAKLAAVEALADSAFQDSLAPDDFDPNWRYVSPAVKVSKLRAVLASGT